TALLLERQTVEWSSINSRGGSSEQLIVMQAITMAILAVAAFAAGIPAAAGIVIFVGRFSPLSATLGDGIAVTSIPAESIILSAVAAVVAVIALTIPAVPAARASILHLRQSISRPPTTPTWARYRLDLVLTGLGLLLLLRLYLVFGGASIETLLQDPLAMFRLATANVTQAAGVLDDPFNLAAAVLLITGLALVWLRLFPLLMRGVSALFSRTNGLLGTLALWNIARDPGHYAQLVLVLICTLAIGTAALALAATHDLGAWNSARSATGGEALVSFAPEAPAATNLPDSAELLMHYTTAEPEGNKHTDLYGVSVERFAALSGEMPPTRDQPGIPLPPDIAEVSLQVYAEPVADATVSTRLALDVVNAIGVPRSIPLTTPDDTVTGAFAPYTAALPDDPHLPYTLVGIRFLSRIGSGRLEHVVYLDDLAYTTADGERVRLDDFERSSAPDWTSRAQAGGFGVPIALFAAPSQSHAAVGAYALRVQYVIEPSGARLTEPVLAARSLDGEQPIPVILSAEYAATLGKRAQRADYAVGDTGSVAIILPTGGRELRFRIAAILPIFPTASDRFVIAQADGLRQFLNATASPDRYYTTNTAWLTLPTRQLSGEQRTQIAALPGITEVTEAWDRYNLLLREPLPNAIIGVLFAGFWVSLALGLLDFGVYLTITAARRATTFAVLRAMGWRRSRVWGLLTAEQTALTAPALVIGVLLGAILAELLLPFLALFGSETLRLPLAQIAVLLLALIVGFGILLTWTAFNISRVTVSQVLRMDE
ncbi:MAG: ABC transporter permease, partial [Anaerolineae bacterium]|nr:ABC transporter permease [Anaerolineae bacterium]